MEITNETADCAPNSLVRINEIVNENLQKTWRLQARIKYLRIECGNLDKEIREIQANIETENETCKTLEVNLERALRTKESEIHSIDIATKLHPQLVQRKIDENRKLKEATDIFMSTYDKHWKMFEDFKCTIEARNPLLRQLSTLTSEIKKLEFDKKFLGERIKDAEMAHELKKGIYQKMFHSIIVKFVQAVSQYHHRENIMNELKQNQLLMENQHKEYRRKCLEQGNKHVSDNISNRTEVSKLNLQLSVNLVGNTYQSILPEILLRSSHHNYEMAGTDIANILNKKMIEEQNEMLKRTEFLKTKRQLRKSNEDKLKKVVQGSKRSFEDADSLKSHKKAFKPKESDAELKISSQTKLQGIMKKSIEKATVNEQITSSQKSIDKQVVFNVKDDTSTEKTSVNSSNKSQEKISQLQPEKTKQTTNEGKHENPAAQTNFNFMLSSHGSQVPKNTKQTIRDLNQNKEEQKCPASSILDFGAEFQIGNKNTQQNVTRKSVENLNFFKTGLSSSMRDENREFSPYFRKPESQSGKDNLQEDQEKAKNSSDATTDLEEYEYIHNTGKAGSYVSYEFLTPQEDELSATQNITFLGEDKPTDSRERNDLFFNLGQVSSQSSSFKPFSFFN